MNIEMLASILEQSDPDGEVFFSHNGRTFTVDEIYDCVRKFSFLEETKDSPMIYIFKLKEDVTAPISAK